MLTPPSIPREISLVISTQPARDEMFMELAGLVQSHNENWEVYKTYLKKYRNMIHDFVTNLCISVIYDASCYNRQQQRGLEPPPTQKPPLYRVHASQSERVDADFRAFYFSTVVGSWQNGVSTMAPGYTQADYEEMANAVIFNVRQTFIRDLQLATGPNYPCLENFVGVKRLSDWNNSDIILTIKLDLGNNNNSIPFF